MPRVRPSILVHLLTIAVVGCQRSAPAVGDAIPRVRSAANLLTVIRPTLDSFSGPHLRMLPFAATREEYRSSDVWEARNFANDRDVIAVVGHSGSKESLYGAPVYNAVGVPQLVPTGTSSRLADAGAWTFMMAPTDSVEGVFLVDYAADSLGARRIAVVAEGDAYGLGIRDGVVAQLRRRELALVGAVLLTGRECNGGSLAGMRGIVRALLDRAHPDLLIVALRPAHTACLMHQLDGIDSTRRVLAADSFYPAHAGAQTLTDRERRNLRFVSLWDEQANPASRAFADATSRVLGRAPMVQDAFVRDAYVAIAAAVAAEGASRAGVRRYLESLGGSRPALDGVTGPIQFRTPRTSTMTVRRMPMRAPSATIGHP